MKYLTKSQVHLGVNKPSEPEREATSTEDKNWGVEEDDKVRYLFYINYEDLLLEITND